jgi:hypothetical protein
MGRKKSESDFKIVIVKWGDACTINETMKVSEAKEEDLYLRESVGFLVKKGKTKITLSMTYDHADDNVDVITIIPRSWVKEIIELK